MAAFEEKQLKQIREHWFPNHIATLSSFGPFEVLDWRNPDGGSIFAVRYVAFAGTLVVLGDIGEAVYRVHDIRMGLRFWAGTNLDYFAMKCVASEYGRKFVEWDADEAVRVFRELTQANFEDNAADKILQSVDDWRSVMESSDEWVRWLDANGYEVLGDDFWEWAVDVGEVFAHRCVGHHEGLKLSFKQLDKTKTG
jgi:hypothetical protein